MSYPFWAESVTYYAVVGSGQLKVCWMREVILCFGFGWIRGKLTPHSSFSNFHSPSKML